MSDLGSEGTHVDVDLIGHGLWALTVGSEERSGLALTQATGLSTLSVDGR